MDNIVSDKTRIVINTGFVGDEMQMTWRDGELYVEIDEPWQGDTESGFGARCSVTLDAATARKLARWLNEVLAGEQKP